MPPEEILTSVFSMPPAPRLTLTPLSGVLISSWARWDHEHHRLVYILPYGQNTVMVQIRGPDELHLAGPALSSTSITFMIEGVRRSMDYMRKVIASPSGLITQIAAYVRPFESIYLTIMQAWSSAEKGKFSALHLAPADGNQVCVSAPWLRPFTIPYSEVASLRNRLTGKILSAAMSPAPGKIVCFAPDENLTCVKTYTVIPSGKGFAAETRYVPGKKLLKIAVEDPDAAYAYYLLDQQSQER
jgi:hypothetical protein